MQALASFIAASAAAHRHSEAVNIAENGLDPATEHWIRHCLRRKLSELKAWHGGGFFRFRYLSKGSWEWRTGFCGGGIERGTVTASNRAEAYAMLAEAIEASARRIVGKSTDR